MQSRLAIVMMSVAGTAALFGVGFLLGLGVMSTPKPELNSPDYGYGFVVDQGGRIVGHSGGFNGINSQLDIYVGEDYTLAVMSNYGGGAQPIVDKVRTLMLAGTERTASKR